MNRYHNYICIYWGYIGIMEKKMETTIVTGYMVTCCLLMKVQEAFGPICSGQIGGSQYDCNYFLPSLSVVGGPS